MSERAEAHTVVGTEPGQQFPGALAQQRQIALHAARDVEHHDEADGLWRVVEERDRLRLAFVTNLEVLLLERGDETAVTIGDGDEHADGVAGAAKRRLLLSGRAKCRAYTRGEDSRREDPGHTLSPNSRRQAPHSSSIMIGTYV